MKLSDEEYLATLNTYIHEAEYYITDVNEENDLNYSYYFRELLGNERPGESQAVSSDCFDVVESDMPSMVRTFLGGGDVMQFVPDNESDEVQTMEAKQKTEYINRILLQDFTTWYDWLKAAEISNYSVVTYFPEETSKPEIIRQEGMSRVEVDALLNTLEEDDNVEKVEIESEESYGDEWEIEFKVTRKRMKYCFEWVPEESFLFVPSKSLDSSPMVGHMVEKTKGELVGMFPKHKAKIKELPQSVLPSNNDIDDTKERQISRAQTNISTDYALNNGGGVSGIATPEWYAEKVVTYVLSVLVDRDGDGYAERRRVIKADNLILEDEPYDHVPYALLSCYPIPGKAIGKSRVSVTRESQRQKSLVQRGIFNNIASVNKPMVGVNIGPEGSTANIDDLMNRRVNGVVRTKGDPSTAMFPMVTPYIGSQALEVIQYLDFQRAQTTGALMASQGLTKDSITDETATRFDGIQGEGAAKTELIMRVFAETGIKKLFEGMAWTVQNHQNSNLEAKIGGEQIVFDPSRWRYDHVCKPRVGLAADDTDELKRNLAAILNILQGLQAAGSTIADESKIYNTIKKILNTMGVYDVSEFINNPEIPDETSQAQLEQAKKLIAQLQQQVQTNPLAEAEQVKAQARLIEAQAKDQTDRDKARADAYKYQEDLKLRREQLELDETEFRANFALDVTKTELEYNKNLDGGLDGRDTEA